MLIAISTKGHKGLKDELSDVFARAETFTLIDVKNGKVREVRVIDNPAVSYSFGAGPIATQVLKELGVNVIITRDIGPNAQELIRKFKIKILKVDNVKVEDAVKKFLF